MKSHGLSYEYSCGIIPINQKESKWSVLIVQHRAGHWAFPKGHREPEEKPIQTALRELQEETGITDVYIIPKALFRDSYSFDKDNVTIRKQVNYFLGVIKNQNVVLQSDELSDYRWLPIHQAITKLTYRGAQTVLNEVKIFLDYHLI